MVQGMQPWGVPLIIGFVVMVAAVICWAFVFNKK